MASAKSVGVPGGPELRSELGEVLRRHREARARTLTELAGEAGCSPAYLSEVERGLKDVSSDLLVAIAHALGLPLGALFHELADGFEPGRESWPRDPLAQLRIASASLPPNALRTVAQFSVFLAGGPGKPARRIGFIPPGDTK
jgi:transcriptional regulator with XRE-family HTH domain